MKEEPHEKDMLHDSSEIFHGVKGQSLDKQMAREVRNPEYHRGLRAG